MARSKRTHQAYPQTTGSPEAGVPIAAPRPLNQRARNRKMECRWIPDVESDLGKDTSVSRSELEAIWQLLGEDLDRLLDD